MRRYTRSSLPSLDDVATIMASRRYQQVSEYPIEGQFTVSLWQSRSGFAVVYGLQLTAPLTYSQASQELGGCLMHALSCQGALVEK